MLRRRRSRCQLAPARAPGSAEAAGYRPAELPMLAGCRLLASVALPNGRRLQTVQRQQATGPPPRTTPKAASSGAAVPRLPLALRPSSDIRDGLILVNRQHLTADGVDEELWVTLSAHDQVGRLRGMHHSRNIELRHGIGGETFLVHICHDADD